MLNTCELFFFKQVMLIWPESVLVLSGLIFILLCRLQYLVGRREHTEAEILLSIMNIVQIPYFLETILVADAYRSGAILLVVILVRSMFISLCIFLITCDIYRTCQTKLRECNAISVMSDLSVMSVHKREGVPCDHYHWTADHPQGLAPPQQPIPGHGTSLYGDPQPKSSASDIWMANIGDLFKLLHLRTPPPSPVLPSGSHRSMYGWEASSTHPTATKLDMKTQSQVEEKIRGKSH